MNLIHWMSQMMHILHVLKLISKVYRLIIKPKAIIIIYFVLNLIISFKVIMVNELFTIVKVIIKMTQ